jgi:hypothetical protein
VFHKRYTQFPDADRENLLPIDPTMPISGLFQLFTVNLTGKSGRSFTKGGLISSVFLTVKAALGALPAAEEGFVVYEWMLALNNDQPEEAQRSVRWNRVLLAFHSVVFAICVFMLGDVPLFFLISFGTFIAQWLRAFMGMTQHIGLRSDVPDFRKNTRTITLPFAAEFLYWRMNWHIEHHMFAAVPCYNLASLHNVVKGDMPATRTLFGAWREMCEVWAQQEVDPGYAFDTPVPSAVRDGEWIIPDGGADRGEQVPSARAVNEGVASIGDLAPEGLR